MKKRKSIFTKIKMKNIWKHKWFWTILVVVVVAAASGIIGWQMFKEQPTEAGGSGAPPLVEIVAGKNALRVKITAPDGNYWNYSLLGHLFLKNVSPSGWTMSLINVAQKLSQSNDIKNQGLVTVKTGEKINDFDSTISLRQNESFIIEGRNIKNRNKSPLLYNFNKKEPLDSVTLFTTPGYHRYQAHLGLETPQVSTTEVNGQVKLQFSYGDQNKKANVAALEIQRRNVSGGGWKKIHAGYITGQPNYYLDEAAQKGTNYQYRVRALDIFELEERQMVKLHEGGLTQEPSGADNYDGISSFETSNETSLSDSPGLSVKKPVTFKVNGQRVGPFLFWDYVGTNTGNSGISIQSNVKYFRIHRGTTPDFTPGSGNRIGIVNPSQGNAYLDQVGEGVFYYKVVAVFRDSSLGDYSNELKINTNLLAVSGL